MNSASSGWANRTSALANVPSFMILPAYRPGYVARHLGLGRCSSGDGTTMGPHRHPVARPEDHDIATAARRRSPHDRQGRPTVADLAVGGADGRPLRAGDATAALAQQ